MRLPISAGRGSVMGISNLGDVWRDNILVLVLDKVDWWKLDLLLLNKEELFLEYLAAVS